MCGAPAIAVADRARTSALCLTPLKLALVFTSAGLALRLLDLGSRPLWLDEAFSAWFSDHDFHYLWHVLPTYEPHPPFFYSLLRAWRLLIGSGDLSMRLLSALLGTAIIPVAMAIVLEQEREAPSGRKLLRVGVAGLLAACSPMFMAISQEARPYPLLALGYSLAILFVLRLGAQFRNGGAGSWIDWAMLGTSVLLTSWSHALGILYAAVLGLTLLPLWLSRPVNRERLVRGILTATVVAAAYLPCLLMVSSRAHDWSTNWLQWQPMMFLPQLLALYTIPVEALTVASAVAALAMVLLFKRAIVWTWRSKGWNSDRLLLLLWLGPPFLAAIISATLEPVFLARTLTGTLVPAYVIVAGAVARLQDPRERRIIVAALCIPLVPTAAAFAARPAMERWDLLSTYLSEHVRTGDQVWLYPADSALPLKAVGMKLRGSVIPVPEPFPTLHSHGPARAGWRAVVSVTPAEASRLANDARLKNVAVIWLVTRQSAIFDPDNDLSTALSQVRRPGRSIQWGYIAAQPFYPK